LRERKSRKRPTLTQGSPTDTTVLGKELNDIKKLLILSASKAGATSDEIGKVLTVGGSQIRNILAGESTSKRRRRRNS